eukprot:c21498_g1_i3 orf=303-1787(+)
MSGKSVYPVFRISRLFVLVSEIGNLIWFCYFIREPLEKMPWFPDMAISAFCDTVQLCQAIVGKWQLAHISACQGSEPGTAEFIAALAAGSNSRNILQVGCGLTTIALAAAARATGTRLLSVHTVKEEQEIVHHHVKRLGLIDYVEFVVDETTDTVSQIEDVDFAVFTGHPECYIRVFDLLKLKHSAIIIADNALHESTNEYIKHVHHQPGVESSTLPLGRGIEVTKIINWNEFKSGRILYTGLLFDDAKNSDTVNGLKGSVPSPSSVELVSSGSRFQQLDAINQNMSYSQEGTCHSDCGDACSCSMGQIDENFNPPTSEDNQFQFGLEQILETTDVASGNSYRELLPSSEIVFAEETVDIQSFQLQEERQNFFLSVTNFGGQSDPYVLNPTDMTSDKLGVHFRNRNSQAEASEKRMDQHMVLTDITMAFNEMGVSSISEITGTPCFCLSLPCTQKIGFYEFFVSVPWRLAVCWFWFCSLLHCGASVCKDNCCFS